MLHGNLQLDLGGFALDSGDFNIPLRGVTVLFGRSGSGKSTLLRAISGLDKRTRGSLVVKGQFWQKDNKSLPVQKRDIGFVFQDAALFPHLSVRQNLEYGIKRLDKQIEAADFNDIVIRVGILELLDRKVTYLSGGERQRVAIARALLMRPKLLCMDEPLSALDWRSKAELLILIEEIIEQYSLPVLYITHAPAEVERLADRVLFMKEGKVERMETLQEALARPDSPLFDEQGAVSVLLGSPQQVEDGLQRIEINQNSQGITKHSLWVGQHLLVQKPQVRVRILARDVSIGLADPENLSIINHLKVKVGELIPQGEHRVLVRLFLDDGQHLFAEITKKSVKRLHLLPGLVVFALIKTVAMTE
ncbi:molybdenum ABC transporter ATP-binding protein [Thiomicrorhabdus hydrogeniphila]